MANTTFLDLPVAVTVDPNAQVPIASTNSSATAVTQRASAIQIAGLAVNLANNTTLTALSVFGNSSSASTLGTSVAGVAGQVLRVNDGGTSLAFGQINLSNTASVTGTISVTLAGLSVFGVTGTASAAAAAITGTASQVLAVNPSGTGLIFTSSPTIGGTLNVSGSINTSSTLGVIGAAVVTGNVGFGGTLNVTGNTNIIGTLNVTGAASFNSSVAATGNLSTLGNLSVSGTSIHTGNALFGGTITATGTISTLGSLGVAGTSIHTGNAGFGGTVSVTGAISGLSTLAITGAAVVTGNVGIGGTLNVTGAVTFGTVLGVASGGVGTSALTANSVLLGNGTSGVIVVANATSTFVLTSNGTNAAPTFQAAGAAASYPGLSVLGVTGTVTTNATGIVGTANQVLVVNSGATALSFAQVNLTAGVTGILPIANGGTNASTAATAVTNLGALSASATGQTMTAGFVPVLFSLGTAAGSTLTLVPGNGPLQNTTSAGTFTFVAPANDGECDVIVYNATGASTITIGAGFGTPPTTGDTYSTVVGNYYIFMSRTIHGKSTYAWKAIQ